MSEPVKRYSQWCGATHGHGMNEHEHGTYVLSCHYDAETARADRAEADNAELLARLEASERVVTAYLEHQAHQPVTPLEDGVFPKWWETDLHLQRNLHEALRAYDAAAIRRGEQG